MNDQPSITVYGKPRCVQCDATKRALNKRGIPYTYVDVTENPDALAHIKALGYTSAPVVELSNGIDSWSGYQPGKLALIAEGF